MVAIRTFIGVAALATAVLAAPTASKDMSSDCVSSGGSGCGSDMSKMDDSNKMDDSKMSSDCGSDGCGSDMSKMDDSKKMDMGSDCGESGCGSDMSKMDDSKKMDMGSDCGESGCGDDKKMDDSKMSSDCGESGCGDKKMDMSSDCVSSGGSGCDKQTSTAEATSTSTYSSSYATATYGSGSSNWKMYDDCVQQCVAKFGSDSKNGSDSGSSGSSTAATATETTVLGEPGKNGVTHTVVVAPTQGVLRFVPFAVMNAQVGDTIKYEWHANNHTVTKGSALELCNKSKSADTFASGLHNKGTTYFQTVNTTDPVYIYCANPGHCQKGMFGVINPKTTNDPAVNMQGNMEKLIGSDNGTMAGQAYNDNLNGTNNAQTWGSALSLQDVPEELKGQFAQNVQYTRALLSMNSDLVGNNGTIKMDTTKNVNWPADVGAAVDVAAAASSSPAAPQNAATAPASAGSSSASAAATTSAPSDKKNGARGLGVSGAAVAFVAVAASLLAL